MILQTARRVALWCITVLVAASTLVAFGESYRALYLWAARHDVPGGWALAWPLMVDVFTMTGELALFVALADRWPPRSRVFAWVVTLAGLSVSVAANIGHVASHTMTARATAAVPPLAAASALAVGLGVLKRVVQQQPDTSAASVHPAASVTDPLLVSAETAFPETLGGGTVPSVRRIQRTLRVGQARAQRVRAHLEQMQMGST